MCLPIGEKLAGVSLWGDEDAEEWEGGCPRATGDVLWSDCPCQCPWSETGALKRSLFEIVLKVRRCETPSARSLREAGVDTKVPRDLIYNKISLTERAQCNAVHTDVGNEVTGYSFSSSLSADNSASSSSECPLPKQELKTIDDLLRADIPCTGCVAFFSFFSSFWSRLISCCFAFSSAEQYVNTHLTIQQIFTIRTIGLLLFSPSSISDRPGTVRKNICFVHVVSRFPCHGQIGVGSGCNRGREAMSFRKLINGGSEVEVEVTANYKAVELFVSSK